MKTCFSHFRTISLPETTPATPLGFFEAVGLSDYAAGEYVRIPAAVQRRFFGCVPFGKLGVKIDGATCTTLRSVAYGCDFDKQAAYWSQADSAWRCQSDNKLLATFPR